MLFALLLVQAVSQSAPADAPNDIVVTALRKLRLSTEVADGAVTACRVKVSSGDPAIDRAACDATVACFNSGVTQPEPLADCVDARVVAFVREGRKG